jgi:hypothetical protein
VQLTTFELDGKVYSVTALQGSVIRRLLEHSEKRAHKLIRQTAVKVVDAEGVVEREVEPEFNPATRARQGATSTGDV